MSKPIDMIEGIGPAYKEKFGTAGINTVDALLEKGATPAGRKSIAEATGFSESVVLNFVNMADLFRVNGVAGQFAELLKASGVDTIKELATRNPENLWTALCTTNDAKSLCKVVPSVDRITDFIAQAAKMEKVVTH